MKALSILQPWAWILSHPEECDPPKLIENRTWSSLYRGFVLIHTGKAFDYKGYRWVRENFPKISLPDIKLFDRGGIVGPDADCGLRNDL